MLVSKAPVAWRAACASITYTCALGGSRLRKSGASVDSNCLGITLKWGALANRRSNSLSTRGCGDNKQTVSLEDMRFGATVATVLEGSERQAQGQEPWAPMFTSCY